MHIDVTRHIGAVIREVGTREKDGKQARYLIATRTYDTSVDDLWDALTSRERIPRWFMPITGDLRLGGSYQLQGNASGTVTACDPPRHFALTWGMHGDLSWVDVRLHDDPKGTRLELEHVAFVPEAMWKQFGPGGAGVGWESGLLGLALHLVGGAAVAPEAAAGWVASANGKEFMTRASDAWGEAAIAAGDDPAAARAAAAQTAAMYTGG